MKLEFKQNEVVIAGKEKTTTEETAFTTGKKEIEQAIVLYVGAKCELGYKEGDKILFENIASVKEKTLLGEDLRIMDEMVVICKVS